MTQILGFCLILILIVAGLAATGADAIFWALPFELALIGGAAIGTLLLGNSLSVAMGALKGFWLAVRGSPWSQGDFADLLSVLHELCRRERQGGAVSIEEDVEAPESSPLFAAAPRLLGDGAAIALTSDAFRLAAIDMSDPRRAEARMDSAIDQHLAERMRSVAALQTMGDALPALGIVAAVLGIIKTMTAIDASTAVLGELIASALLGTFLGVFLAYGLVGPIAARFGQVVEEDAVALETIRTFLTAHFGGASPSVSLELARAGIPAARQPGLEDLDRAVEAVRFTRHARAA
ncbi:MAG: flagellar motor stator protein MotA [Hyphomonadaceae bacterium]|nr:flagellar motor stator protein MotA [Hyphomonadaceae bacterium]